MFVVVALGAAPSHARAGSASEDYATARKAWKTLQASAEKQKFRHNWIRVIRAFEQVATEHPASGKADDALYMAGSLYFDLYGVSYLRTDLNSSRKAFQRLIDKYPHSNLADDAQFHIAKSYRLEKKNTEAYRAFQKVIDGYPNGDMHAAAKKELAVLPKPSGVAASRPTPVALATPTPTAARTPTPTPTPYHAQVTPPPGGFAITDVKHWSNPDYTRIVIYLSGEVSFDHAELPADPKAGKPPRIYVDLESTRIGKDFAETYPYLGAAWEVPIDDGLLTRARVAQFKPDVARVVLDVESIDGYAVIPMFDDPFRIVLDIYGQGYKGTPVASLARPPTDKQVADRAKKLAGDGTASLAEQLGLKTKTVVIDAGHGGHDTGALGPNGKREKDVVLAVALKVAARLRKEGFHVVMTRDDDTFVKLEERTAMANKLRADLFVSIHANASTNKSAHGAETYFLDAASDADAIKVAARENATTEKKVSDLERIVEGLLRNAYVDMSADLAHDVQENLCEHKKKKHTLTNRGVRTAPFIVLATANMPSVLVETGFISHPKEEKMLSDRAEQDELAEGIAAGISHYVSMLGAVSAQADGTGKSAAVRNPN